MAMFINSIQHWIFERGKKRKSKKCSSGTIIELELVLPYKTETPYRHSALVIKEYKNKVLIVPSTSKKDFLEVAYHPIDKPNGNKTYRKVGKEDGFDHDCVLILNDFKVVSKNRIISTCGIVDTISDNCLYKEIKRTLLNDIFEEEVYEYENKIEEMNKIIESEKREYT